MDEVHIEVFIIDDQNYPVSTAGAFWLAWVKYTALDILYQKWQQDIAMMRLEVNNITVTSA